MDSICSDLIARFRIRFGLKLLNWALVILPEWSWQFKALVRDLADQREYERYEGYTLLMGGAVLPFAVWHHEWRGMTRMRRPIQMPQRQESNARVAWSEKVRA